MKARFLLLVALPVAVLISTLGIHWVEGSPDNAFGDLFDSFWWTIVTFTTVGYGDIAPTTHEGRAFAILILCSGVLVNSIIISLVSNWFFEFRSNRARGLKPIDLKDHILICSDDTNFVITIIQENRRDYEEGKIVLVAPGKEHPLTTTPFEKLPWISGMASQIDILKKASASLSRIAYVAFEDDSDTVMAIMQIEDLSQGETLTMALDNDSDYQAHMENVGCDFSLNPLDIYVPMMVQAYISPGASTWMREIILREHETPTIETVNIPPGYRQKPWMDYLVDIKNNLGRVALGMVDQNGRILANPSGRMLIHEKNQALCLVSPKTSSNADQLEEGIDYPESSEILEQGHLLICSDQLHFIQRCLKELELAGINEEIMVVCEHECPPDFLLLSNVHWIHAGSYSDEGFHKARCNEAKVAFIDHQRDSHTLMSVLRMETHTQGNIFTIASFHSIEFGKKLKQVGCDFCINADELVVPLLSQSATHKGVGMLVEQIISQDSSSESIFVRRLKTYWKTISWLELMIEMKAQYDYLPVSLIKKIRRKLLVNPHHDTLVEAGDMVLFITKTGADVCEDFEPHPVLNQSNSTLIDLENIKDPKVKQYFQSAIKGNAKAQFNLGLLYERGRQLPKNYSEAYRWYMRAARQGHARSQYHLGLMYFRGKGLTRNMREAYSWFHQAALHGHEDAQKIAQSFMVNHSLTATGHVLNRENLLQKISEQLDDVQKLWFIKVVIRMILIDGKMDHYEKSYLHDAIHTVNSEDDVQALEEAILFGQHIEIGPETNLPDRIPQMILQELVDLAVANRHFSLEEQTFIQQVGIWMGVSETSVASHLKRGRDEVLQMLRS